MSKKINLASDEAGEEALRIGLTAGELEGKQGSGEDGALTTQDVRNIANARPMRVRAAYMPKVDGVWVNGVRIDPKPKDLNDGE